MVNIRASTFSIDWKQIAALPQTYWVRKMGHFSAYLFVEDIFNDFCDPDLDLPSVVLFLQHHKTHKTDRLTVPLTEMTVPELDAFKEIVNEAFDIARIVCQARDDAVRADTEIRHPKSRLFRADFMSYICPDDGAATNTVRLIRGDSETEEQ